MGTDNYYSVKEDVQKYIDGCKTKMNVRTHKVFGRAVLAGMMIAFGASASNVAAHAVTNVGLSRLVAGCVFPVGLMMVVLLGAELFTGDCLMAVSYTHLDVYKRQVYEGIDMESTLPGAEWIATFNGIITEPKFVIFNDDTNKKVIVENGQEVEFDDTDVFAIFFPLEKEIVRAELDDNLTFKSNSVKKNVRYYDNISARIKDGDKVEIKQRLEVDGEEETLTVTLVIKRN